MLNQVRRKRERRGKIFEQDMYVQNSVSILVSMCVGMVCEPIMGGYLISLSYQNNFL